MTQRYRYCFLLFLLGFIWNHAAIAQPKGFALLVGATKTGNPFKYDPRAVAKADKDAESMRSLLRQSGFADSNIIMLSGREASVAAVLSGLKSFTKKLRKDDMFVFYFSGHGDTLADLNHDELPFTFDQQLIVADGGIVDDTLFHFFKLFRDSVRLVCIVDACFSGESYKINTMMARQTQRAALFSTMGYESGTEAVRGSGCNVRTDAAPFSMLYAGAVERDRVAFPLADGGGVLTKWICDTWQYLRLRQLLASYTFLDFFRQSCLTNPGIIIVNVKNGASNLFGARSAFQL